MKNDIGEWLSAAALIEVLSTREHHFAHPRQLRLAASALYIDRDALWNAIGRRLSNLAMACDGETFRIVNGPFAGYLVDPADVDVHVILRLTS